LARNRDHGITVLMVTHEQDMAAYAHRMVQFVDGGIASDKPNPNPTTTPPPVPSAAAAAAAAVSP
ncbi:MAG: macrolide ABC transporter ATP-binding protein, partial [Bacteroidia bacterium]